MLIIEILYFLSMLVLGVISSKTDLKEGKIYNKILLRFTIISFVLGVLYYGIFAQDIYLLFVVNFTIVTVISLVLFYTHCFAGGDCKLAIVMASLYPANYYLLYNGMPYTLFFFLAFSMLFGYFYLLFSATKSLIKNENNVSIDYFKNYIVVFLKNFAISTIYLCALNLLFVFLNNLGFVINTWILRIICMIFTWLVCSKEFLRNKYLLGFIIVLDVILGFLLRLVPFSLDPRNYIIVIVLLLCQMTIRTNIYQEIKISDIKEGMILTTFSSLMMQGSRVRNMPGISTEDLKSRLDIEEVESIKRWAKSRNVEYVSIVRKIPFAIFIFMGFLSYLIIWGLLR